MKSAKGILLLLIVTLVLSLATSASAFDVLLLHTYGAAHDILAADIESHADITSVTQWDGTASTPTLGDLSAYDAIFLEGNIPWLDASGIGDVVADYLDGGGVGLVVTEGAFMDASFGWSVSGRLRADGYLPFTLGVTEFSQETMTTYTASHPIFAGVSSDPKGTYWGSTTLATTAGADVIGSWSGGANAVATLGNVVGINCNGYDGYDAEMALVFGNALLWSFDAAQPPSITSIDPDTAMVDDMPTDVAILGDYFIDGDTEVKLYHPDVKTEILGTNVTVTDAQNLTFDIDLTGAVLGMYDVIVTTSYGEDTLSDGFEVTAATDDDDDVTDDDDDVTDDDDDTTDDDDDTTDDDDSTDDDDTDDDDTDDDDTTGGGGDDDDDDDGCCG